MPNFRITQQHTTVQADSDLFNAVWRIVDPTNVSHDGHGIYSYIGEGGSSEKDIASIRTLHPLDPTKKEGLSSFEITLQDTGELNYIAMGVCDSTYPSHLLPGWEGTSVAFHMDEGSIFNSSDDAIPLNQPCKTGNIIKVSISTCPLDPAKVTVDFYCNGNRVYSVDTLLPGGGFFGVVGLMSLGEKIKISEPAITKKVEFEELWEVATPHAITHEGWGVCAYSGAGDYKETSIGTIRSKSPVNPLGEVSTRTLEIRIIDPGEARYIAIGVVNEAYPTNLFPGWKDPSVGYHADNGNLFCGAERSTNRPCKAGDTMKCVLESVDRSPKRVKISFFRNSASVGQVTAWTPQGGFYMCVGMMSQHEKVDIVLPEIAIPYKPSTQANTIRYEDYWDEITPHLVHEGEGVYQYVGQGGQDFVGSIRSKHPLDPFGPKNWFEVKIVNAGMSCYIAMGVCSKLYAPNKLVGWDDLSVGFHADDGLILQKNLDEKSTSHPCKTGDVIRVAIELIDGADKQVKVVFYRNGNIVGDATFWRPSSGYHAQIGCMSVGEAIKVHSPLMGATPAPTSNLPSLPSSQSASSVMLSYRQERGLPPEVEHAPPGDPYHHGDVPPDHYMFDPHYFFHHPYYQHAMRHPFPPGGGGGGGGGFQPAQSPHGGRGYMPHPSLLGHPAHVRPMPHPPHPHMPLRPRALPDPSQRLPLYGDPNALFPPAVRSPSQTQRQLSEQPVKHSVAPSTQRLHTHPPDHPISREGVFSPAPDIDLESPLDQMIVQQQHGLIHGAPQQTKGYPPKGLIEKPPTERHPGPSTPPTERRPGPGVPPAERRPGPGVPPAERHPGSGVPPTSRPGVSPTERLPGPCVPHVERPPGPSVLPPVKRPPGSGVPPAERSPSTAESKGLSRPRSKEERGGVDHTDSIEVPLSHAQLPTSAAASPVEERVEHPTPVSSEETTPHHPPIGGRGPVDSPKPGKCKMRPPLFSQLSVVSSANVKLIPKEENRLFKILHNVNFETSDGPFENALPKEERLDNAFVISRLPLTEKSSYFEVEVEHIGANGNIAMGLIWDNYPVFHLPGALEGSVAFHTLTGSMLTGGAEVEPSREDVTCNHGDVVGCRALLNYKSEISDKNENLVTVEFYFNGCVLCTANVVLPPSGFFPAIGFKGYRSRVRYSRSIQLSPETYFETHPLPKDYRNFTSPPPLSSGWSCLRNSEVKSDVFLHMTEQKPGTPAVIQNHAPLSKNSPYFEVELQYSIKNYSVLAIGATPKAFTDAKRVIPGEAPGSVGLLPLLGFVMMNSAISTTVPDVVQAALSSPQVTLGIGVEFLSPASSLDTSMSPSHSKSDKLSISSSECPSSRVLVFFTINRQQVSSIYTTLPEDGLYASLAVDSDSVKAGNVIAKVHFPAQWPPYIGLPVGFVRGAREELDVFDMTTVIDKRPPTVELSQAPVYAIQAATPLSHSHPYYEIQIIDGGGTFKISCGLAPFNYHLNTHPGWGKDSIALHADDGALFQDGVNKPICPSPKHRGVVLGCGLRFPDGAAKRYAEAYFTVNRRLVAKRLVKVPQLGLFPTVGMRTQRSVVTIDLFAPDPLPDIKFRTAFEQRSDCKNVRIDGNVIQLISLSEPGALIQTTPYSPEDLAYFSVTPLTEREGRVIMGFSTSSTCPLDLLNSHVEGLKAYAVDITMGVVMVYDRYFQTKESFGVQKGREFGCGLLRQSSINKLLLFVTVDGQAISFTAIEDTEQEVYPFVILMDSPTRISVDMCAMWPPSSPVGVGWARHSNIKLKDARLTHSAQPGKHKFPVGFLQSSTPLTPFSPYFEIEIFSRASDKAIAIGLASRRYPTNSWVGWSADSIAYHLDDGKLFRVSNFGHNFGPKAFAGDTVGCGVRFSPSSLGTAVKKDEKVEVFFTMNGGVIGTQKVPIPAGGLFPTVCLESPSESVVVSRHDQYPPVPSMVCEREWSNAYCILQSGLILHNSHHKLVSGMTKAFCQAREPFTTTKCYFEVLITGSSESSQVQVGLSTYIPRGTTTPNTYGIVYSAQGQIITRRASHRGTQKYTSHAQKAGIGDRLGCFVVFSGSTPTAVDFYLNSMKSNTINISDFWSPQNVYPIVIFSSCQDSVIPFLNMPRPTWDPHSLAGWLRSERVKLRNRVIEYTGQGKTFHDVGVAQIHQSLNGSKNSYFEVEILDLGEKGTIGVGMAPADYPLGRHPGWEADSIACHGDDGYLFHGDGMGSAFGPVWKKNDVIGLGLRKAAGEFPTESSEVQVYFTRNGEEIGHTSHRVPLGGLFPTIGLHSPGEKVKVYVGDCKRVPCNLEPRRAMWRSLCGIHVTGSGEEGPHTLTYRGYGRTLLKRRVLTSIAISAQPFSSNLQYFEVELLSAGKIGIAVGMAPRGYPMDQATGWVEGSVAYHTDDGRLYTGSAMGTEFGPVSHKGDVIGCGVTLSSCGNTKHCSVFFTYNGCEIGRVRAAYVEGGLFPSVTLTSPVDKVVVTLMETFKPRRPQAMDLFVGLMRINNCSYSDQLVRFSGAGNSGYTNAPAMAQFAVPLHHNRNFFSANIVKISDAISIGLVVKDYPMRYAPGTASVSIAYDVTAGRVKAVYGSNDHCKLDAPCCHRGDTIGCGIDYNRSKEEGGGEYVVFTRNGKVVCQVKLAQLMDDLFPVVGFVPTKKNSVVFMDWSTPKYHHPNPL